MNLHLCFVFLFLWEICLFFYWDVYSLLADLKHFGLLGTCNNWPSDHHSFLPKFIFYSFYCIFLPVQRSFIFFCPWMYQSSHLASWVWCHLKLLTYNILGWPCQLKEDTQCESCELKSFIWGKMSGTAAWDSTRGRETAPQRQWGKLNI